MKGLGYLLLRDISCLWFCFFRNMGDALSLTSWCLSNFRSCENLKGPLEPALSFYKWESQSLGMLRSVQGQWQSWDKDRGLLSVWSGVIFLPHHSCLAGISSPQQFNGYASHLLIETHCPFLGWLKPTLIQLSFLSLSNRWWQSILTSLWGLIRNYWTHLGLLATVPGHQPLSKRNCSRGSHNYLSQGSRWGQAAFNAYSVRIRK